MKYIVGDYYICVRGGHLVQLVSMDDLFIRIEFIPFDPTLFFNSMDIPTQMGLRELLPINKFFKTLYNIKED